MADVPPLALQVLISYLEGKSCYCDDSSSPSARKESSVGSFFQASENDHGSGKTRRGRHQVLQEIHCSLSPEALPGRPSAPLPHDCYPGWHQPQGSPPFLKCWERSFLGRQSKGRTCSFPLKGLVLPLWRSLRSDSLAKRLNSREGGRICRAQQTQPVLPVLPEVFLSSASDVFKGIFPPFQINSWTLE